MMNTNQIEMFDVQNYSTPMGVTELELAAWRRLDINPDVSQLAVLKSLAGHEDGTLSRTICIETGLDYTTVNPRLTQLKQFGLVEDTGERVRTRNRGRDAYIWKVTPFGYETLRKVTTMQFDFDHDFDDFEDDIDFDELTFSDYAEQAMNTAVYQGSLLYPVMGLVSEAGEVADKVKKYFRDYDREVVCDDAEMDINAETRMEIAKELGDVLWYLTAVATDIGYDLDEIAHLNLDKLNSRSLRNVITGSGDNR